MDAIKNAWEKNFFQVPNAIYDNKELNAYELSLLQYLFRLSNNGEAFPSLKNIGETLKCSVPTVTKTIKSLIDKLYIVKKSRKNKNGGQTSNIYILLDPSKRGLVGGVNEINAPTKGDLQPPVNEVDTINTKSINTNLQTNAPKQPFDYSEDFQRFWSIYPRKKEKKIASKSFEKAMKEHSLETILTGTQLYADECEFKKTELQFIKHPKTFLNAESFLEVETEIVQPAPQAEYNKMIDGKLNQIDVFFQTNGRESK